jgi:hypothetical protein
MVAQMTATVPTPGTDTARFHCPTELAFVDANEIENIVHFAAPSKTTTGKTNTVALDVLTGATHCSCRAAECGLPCWHQALAMSAWNGHETRLLVGKFNDAQLQAAGTKAHRMCRVYRARIWRCLPDDMIMLLACRCEYRRRRGVPVSALAA